MDTILSGVQEGFFILLLESKNIKKYYGDRLIIEYDRLQIHSSDRIGIVGVNGAGKSTLIHILTQKTAADEGYVRLYCNYGYVSQLKPPDRTVIRMETASRFLVPAVYNEYLSGGEQTRFKLASCFEQDSQLLFADEPTSNLDIGGIELIEKHFREYQGAIVLISHDRSLLDKICNRILEIEAGQLQFYDGNYSDYAAQKAMERKRAQFEHLQYLTEKKRLENMTIALKEKAQSVKKAPARMGNSEARLHKMGDQRAKASMDRIRKNIAKRIEHLDVKSKPVVQRAIQLDMPDSSRMHSKMVVNGHHLHVAYDDKVIFHDAEFNIRSGSRTALIGANGCGKSTLLKMIVQKHELLQLSQSAKLGYFSQDLRILEESASILENVMQESARQESYIRILLARLLFKHDDVYKPVRILSGGERVKVSLVKVLLKDINFLILDEPTNYLDIASLEVVEEALQSYQGTLLFVSHDRRLIHSVADQMMIIEKQRIHQFAGTYQEYLDQKNIHAEKKQSG